MTTTSRSKSVMAVLSGPRSPAKEPQTHRVRACPLPREHGIGPEDRDEPLDGARLGFGVAVDPLIALAPAGAGVPHPTHGCVDAGEGGRVALVDVDRPGLDPGRDIAGGSD